jgi:hypothetical protein
LGGVLIGDLAILRTWPEHGVLNSLEKLHTATKKVQGRLAGVLNHNAPKLCLCLCNFLYHPVDYVVDKVKVLFVFQCIPVAAEEFLDNLWANVVRPKGLICDAPLLCLD